MREFHISVLEGVLPVRLGMSQDESRRAMKLLAQSYQKVPGTRVDAYLESAFQVYFDGNDAVNYIELSDSAELSAILFGLSVFRTPAEELLSRLSHKVSLLSDDGGYSYVSRSMSLSLWRPALPESDDGDGRYFSTVGVGIRGYYESAA